MSKLEIRDKSIKKNTKVNIKQQSNAITINQYILIAALIVLTFIIYFKSLSYGFLNWDDPTLVTDNPYIKYFKFYSIKDYFTISLLQQYDTLTVLSHVLISSIFGLSPFAFHLGNLLLHIINVLLVFWFVKLITKNFNAAIITSSFFALHPMHVESVAWIAERKDVLYSLFYLTTLISYVFYIKSERNVKFLIIAVFTFILSLLSKFAAVTLPLVLILIDYYYNRKINLKVIIEKIPFFLLAFALGVIHFTTSDAQLSTQVVTENFNAIDRLFLGSFSLFYYFIGFLFPFDICPLHPYPDKIRTLPAIYYASFLFIILIAIGIIYLIKRNKNIRKDIVFGVLFFLGNIGLVLHLIPFGGWVVVADRYSYIAYLGLFLILGKLWVWIEEKQIKTSANSKYIYTAIVSLYLLIFTITTYTYSQNWESSSIFWSKVIEKYPSNSSSAIAYYGLGITKADAKDYKGAMDDYNTAIKLKPAFPDAFNNRGKLKQELKDFQGSLEDFNKTLSLNPNFTKAYHNRGYSYYYLQQYDKAMIDYNKAIELDISYYEAYDNRGIIKFLQKNYKGAITDYNKAIELNPEFAEAYNNRGGANYYLNDFKSAENDYTKAIQLNPQSIDSYKNRSYTRIQLNNIQGACDDYAKARSLGYNQIDELLSRYCK